ncbi:Crp/Fnr family transcriptional regulator [Breoghania sp.]|uniref:Crp/Fnr family transcriptional regulator n=1 Tax=Breoghania sp. TaxID=2065378 RepID=UPI00261A8ACF|nr:Crp/Fnr family transcriptional regulator [Breoghania sp.]MDJ0930047.1 Crp/Fnr family transcriptional regulator [Breoghania sp.]
MKSVGPTGRDLSTIGIFYKLCDGSRERLSAACQWSAYDEGEEIVPYLDKRDDVFFLVSGSARVMIYSRGGKAVAFRTIETGDLFGELAAIDHGPRSASVEASSACVVARLSAEAFRRAMREEPDVMEAVSCHLVAQIRDLTARVFAFSTLPVKTRIQTEILRLAGDPQGHAGPLSIRGFPTHGDLAVRVSTHREAVTRELGRLTRCGILRRSGRDLEIIDVAALRTMVEREEGEE